MVEPKTGRFLAGVLTSAPPAGAGGRLSTACTGSSRKAGICRDNAVPERQNRPILGRDYGTAVTP
jgi:hypothetical protein